MDESGWISNLITFGSSVLAEMPSSGLIIVIAASNPLCLDCLLEKNVIVVAVYGLILARLVPFL
ncbi:hypothetical protein SAMN05421881_11092 [Nitrosomonas halophila]|uniref:Uncharacterized protein n=1 Tax=Nitrosomonas halophila TaxID=44576 RepID=A0A1H3PRS7_9PROT|nr:hypothetical protein SAMN05421881_11092 [Nitrosomonas halophila]